MAQTYRFFLRNSILDKFPLHGIFELDAKAEPEIFHQLTKVLRIKTGDGVVFLNRKSREPFFDNYFVVDLVATKKIMLRFEKKILNEAELPFSLGLVLCLPNKPDKLAFIIQKAVELGVKKITLVEGDFSQFKHKLHLERLEKILIEAAEQSERGQIPILEARKKLKDYLLNLKRDGEEVLLVAMENLHDGQNTFNKINHFAASAKDGGIDILIGPEGGFSSEEMEIITKLKLPCFSLGKRILRMETAVILSLGLAVLHP